MALAPLVSSLLLLCDCALHLAVIGFFFAAAVFASASWSCGAVCIVSVSDSTFPAQATNCSRFFFFFCFSFRRPCGSSFLIQFHIGFCTCGFLFGLFLEFLISERERFFVSIFFLTMCARIFLIVVILCLILFASRGAFFVR